MSAPGILLIGNYPPPFGGVPKHLESLVPHLAAAGWQVHVLSGGTSPDQHGQGFTVYRDRRPAVARRAATMAFLARLAVAGRARAALAASGRMSPRHWAGIMTRVSLAARIVERHDVRLISAYNLLSGAPVGAIIAEMFRLPLVITNFGEIYSHRELVERELPMVRHAAQVATVLTSLTRHCAESYRELGLSLPVRVIRYGIDVSRYAPTAGDGVRRLVGMPAADPLVLYVGRLVRDMGLHTLIAASPELLRSSPTTRLLIAGADGDLRPEAERLVDTSGGRVVLRVNVPEAELPSLYSAATVVVAPTLGHRACGSLAAAEAMAAGKAVVAARVGGVPEYVAHGETGVLVPPDDPAALSAAVTALLRDPERLRAFGVAGRRRAEAMFDAAKTNAELERVFRSLVVAP